jgi:periplasmic protein TonB
MTTLVIYNNEFTYPTHPQEHLAVALFIALIAHVFFIFALGFGWEKPAPRSTTSMEVLLVQQSSDTPVEDADFLAQADQEGGGTASEAELPTITTPAPFPDAVAAEQSAGAPLQVAAAVQATVLEQLTTEQRAQEKVERKTPQEKITSPAEGSDTRTQIAQEPSAVDLILNTRNAIANMQVSLDKKNQEDSKRQRQKFIGAHTREYRLVSYMENWRQKIERIGQLHYPEEARRLGLSGELIVTVAIRADGTVQGPPEIEPAKNSQLRGAELEMLRQAAQQIIRLAAPYAPFPPEVRKDFDVIHITRRWQFSSDGTLGSSW